MPVGEPLRFRQEECHWPNWWANAAARGHRRKRRSLTGLTHLIIGSIAERELRLGPFSASDRREARNQAFASKGPAFWRSSRRARGRTRSVQRLQGP